MNAATPVKPMLAPTVLTYSALLFEGWDTVVYLAGNVSEADGWNMGILPWDVPQGIGPFVFIETCEAPTAGTIKTCERRA